MSCYRNSFQQCWDMNAWGPLPQDTVNIYLTLLIWHTVHYTHLFHSFSIALVHFAPPDTSPAFVHATPLSFGWPHSPLISHIAQNPSPELIYLHSHLQKCNIHFFICIFHAIYLPFPFLHFSLHLPHSFTLRLVLHLSYSLALSSLLLVNITALPHASDLYTPSFTSSLHSTLMSFLHSLTLLTSCTHSSLILFQF